MRSLGAQILLVPVDRGVDLISKFFFAAVDAVFRIFGE